MKPTPGCVEKLQEETVGLMRLQLYTLVLGPLLLLSAYSKVTVVGP